MTSSSKMHNAITVIFTAVAIEFMQNDLASRIFKSSELRKRHPKLQTFIYRR